MYCNRSTFVRRLSLFIFPKRILVMNLNVPSTLASYIVPVLTNLLNRIIFSRHESPLLRNALNYMYLTIEFFSCSRHIR